MAEARPGWYHGKGDPEGTVRYWDGEKWLGEPVMPPDAPAPAAAAASYAPPAGPIYRETPGGFSFDRLVSPNGRVNRATMAGLVGIVFGVVFVLTIVDLVAGTFNEEAQIGLFGGIGSLVLLWPQLATTSKRFHDFGFSGWFAALTIIPFLNFGVLIWLLAHPGNVGANKHGEQPPPGFNL